MSYNDILLLKIIVNISNLIFFKIIFNFHFIKLNIIYVF